MGAEGEASALGKRPLDDDAAGGGDRSKGEPVARKRVRSGGGPQGASSRNPAANPGSSSRQSTRRALRAAIARYSRIGASALAAVQRATVLARRVEEQCASVALVLAASTGESDALQRANALAAQRAMLNVAASASAREGGGGTTKAPALLVDALGRAVDALGNVIPGDHHLSRATKSLKANEKIDELAAAKASKKANPYTSHRQVEAADMLAVVDKRVRPKKRDGRKSRAFAFVEEGHYVKIADATRARAGGEKLSSILADKRRGKIEEIDEAAFEADAAAREGGAGADQGEGADEEKKGDDDDDVSVGGAGDDDDDDMSNDGEVGLGGALHVDRAYDASARSLPRRAEYSAAIPGMEWWDEEFLDKETRAQRNSSVAARMRGAYDACSLEASRFAALVHHPAPVRPVAPEKRQPANAPFYLTKKDRKRIRRQTRAEREREKQDKIQLGLIPPPEPKFKLSNFMKVLGEQAVADPSKMEKKVKEQVNQRLTAHEMRNLARKLTPQEKKEKNRRKIVEDTSVESAVALFYVASLESSQHRYKIDVNARQLALTGGVLICAAPEAPTNLVLVEGGPKAVKKFVGLMTRRIDWAEMNNEAPAALQGGPNWAKLVWQGTVIKRAFQAFRFQECKTTATARRVLEAKGVAHYWDMVRNVHDLGRERATNDETPNLAGYS